MNRRRTVDRTLTGTRIYKRRGQFKYFSPEPMLNPKSGKVTKWHSLCKIEEGERTARARLDELLGTVAPPIGEGDFCAWFNKWRTEIIKKRTDEAPRDPARNEIWRKGTKALLNVLHVVENAFANFDLSQIAPSDVAIFVDQWEGRRAAQVYRGHLSKFFSWCCRRGVLDKNPAREVTVATPKKRDVRMSDAQYVAVKSSLVETGGHNNLMVASLMDLYYLLYQRGTDIRLMRSNELDGDFIEITPSKTAKTSKKKVKIPITDEVRAAVKQVQSIAKLRSVYLFHDEEGQPFTARYAGDIFKSACQRAGISGLTLRDIRSKAATDAKEIGYTEEQIKVALAHTDSATTRDYIRSREVPVSEVVLKLPKG